MSLRHSTDPLLSRSESRGEVIDAGLLARRPMNDPEIVSAHERYGELRPGCRLDSSSHTRLEDIRRPGDRRGGAQSDSTRSTIFRVTPRRSAEHPRPSTPEGELFYAGLDSRGAAAFRNDLVESEPRYVEDDSGHPDPPVSFSITLSLPVRDLRLSAIADSMPYVV